MPLAMPATSRYWTSAGTRFCGWNISVSRSRRASGTFTVARFGSSGLAEKAPVWASERVSALKTVVLPLEGKPMMTNVVDTRGKFLYGTSRARAKHDPAVDYRGAAVDSTRAIAVRSIVVDDSRRPRAV